MRPGPYRGLRVLGGDLGQDQCQVHRAAGPAAQGPDHHHPRRQKITFTYASLLTDLVNVLEVTRPIINKQIPSASVPGWPQFAAVMQALWAARGGRPAAAPAMPGLAARPFPGTPE